jgi:energy-coupling factor transporter ATP-binding protein EcfA2
MLDRRENVEPRHTNTCQWILDLEKYQSWISKSRGLLWIKGKPGAGKSTLMVFLHGKLKRLQNGKPGIQLDFFFTARGTEMQRTPLGMLRSLLNQLFDRDATVRPRVRETYEQRCRQFGYGEGKWKWPQAVLEELLAGVILESTSRQDVTIFVDALDETGAESAQQLAAYFHRLIDRAGEKNAALRICISCRHYPIIGIAQAMEIHVEQHNHEDIATYIKDILAETDVEDNPSEDMRQTLMEKIIQQANGVFQWARLIMPLARQRICEGESFDDIYCWSREVPVGLEDVYMYILNNVIEVRNLEQSFLLFQWVCLAERPLTVTEMRYALAGKNAQITRAPKKWEKIYGFIESDERMKRRIKALSGGLAEVVSSRDLSVTVQVVHQSVNDFLLAKGLAALRENIGASSLVLQR